MPPESPPFSALVSPASLASDAEKSWSPKLPLVTALLTRSDRDPSAPAYDPVVSATP